MESENIYTAIAAKLRQQIMQGEFKDGAVFSQRVGTYQKGFQVTRTTVRHALELLVNEGLLSKKPRAAQFACKISQNNQNDLEFRFVFRRNEICP